MKLLIDADACPVRAAAVEEAKKRGIQVVLVADYGHFLEDGYSRVVLVEKGADSADLKLASLAQQGDIAVTQDYGLAALALAKGAAALNQDGLIYTAENIQGLLNQRYAAAKQRRDTGRAGGPKQKKRGQAQNDAFRTSLLKLFSEGGSPEESAEAKAL